MSTGPGCSIDFVIINKFSVTFLNVKFSFRFSSLKMLSLIIYFQFTNFFIFRLRDNIEELRRSLAPKETALESSQQALLEKEQVCTHQRVHILYQVNCL